MPCQDGLAKLARYYTWTSDTYRKLLEEVFQLESAGPGGKKISQCVARVVRGCCCCY